MFRLLSILAALGGLAGAAAAQFVPPDNRFVGSEDRTQVARGQTVTVSAGQLQHTAELAGAEVSRSVSLLQPMYSCRALVVDNDGRPSIYIDYVAMNDLALISPPQITPYTCELRILDWVLTGGWTLVSLGEPVDEYCSNGGSFTIERVHPDPADMEHLVTITIPWSDFGLCQFRIEDAILQGPWGETWNNAFN